MNDKKIIYDALTKGIKKSEIDKFISAYLSYYNIDVNYKNNFNKENIIKKIIYSIELKKANCDALCMYDFITLNWKNINKIELNSREYPLYIVSLLMHEYKHIIQNESSMPNKELTRESYMVLKNDYLMDETTLYNKYTRAFYIEVDAEIYGYEMVKKMLKEFNIDDNLTKLFLDELYLDSYPIYATRLYDYVNIYAMHKLVKSKGVYKDLYEYDKNGNLKSIDKLMKMGLYEDIIIHMILNNHKLIDSVKDLKGLMEVIERYEIILNKKLEIATNDFDEDTELKYFERIKNTLDKDKIYINKMYKL